MSDQWRAYNQNIRENLEDDEEEEYMMNQIVYQNQLDSSDDEPVQRGGSRPGRQPNKDRLALFHAEMLYNDYFSSDPVFDAATFREVFRMRRCLFMRLHDAVCSFDDYFEQKTNCAGAVGLSSFQKATAAMRMLSLGTPARAQEEYCRLAPSTAREAMLRWCRGIRACFEEEYLRQPTHNDIVTQMTVNQDRGWPGMFGSIDCMHWKWKLCPVALQWSYQDKNKNRSIILEAVCDYRLWIWHAFFGIPGGNNDLNVLDRSPLVRNILTGNANGLGFWVNGNWYDKYYLLADGIYPKWSCFVQSLQDPEDQKESNFSACQESARKDVERCFGVLQSRWSMIANPCRLWSTSDMADVMYACIIMHNMIIEDEADEGLPELGVSSSSQSTLRRGFTFNDLQIGTQHLQESETYYSLRDDLVQHLWTQRGYNSD